MKLQEEHNLVKLLTAGGTLRNFLPGYILYFASLKMAQEAFDEQNFVDDATFWNQKVKQARKVEHSNEGYCVVGIKVILCVYYIYVYSAAGLVSNPSLLQQERFLLQTTRYHQEVQSIR